jgi:hypothetical protein
VDCYAIGATRGEGHESLRERFLADGLVPLDSALGLHKDRTRSLRLPAERRWIAYRTGHLDLLRRPEVYEKVGSWLRPPA